MTRCQTSSYASISRRLTTTILLTIAVWLTIALYALAMADGSFAAGSHSSSVRTSHRTGDSRRAHTRRRHRRHHHTRDAKKTSATHTTKKPKATPEHTSSSGATPITPPAARSPITELPATIVFSPPAVEAPGSKAPASPESPSESSKPEAPTEPPKSEPPSEAPPAKAPTSEEHPTGTGPSSSRKLVWSDEFTGAAAGSPGPDWNFDTGGNGWGNEELESYTSRPSNAELDGQGDLAITARTEKYTGRDGVTRNYTSARLQTLKKFEFQYGLVEARIKVPAGQGLVAQFWALGNEAYEGSEAWPGCGEIDTMEVLGSEPNVVNGTLHAPWSWAPTGVQGQAESSTPLSAGFHVYGLQWEPGRISFMLDGSVYKTIDRADLPPGAAWPFAHPFFFLMDLAVGGEWPGSPNASTRFPAQMLIDWVHVWQ